jgi:hypothetical protein
MPNNNLLNTPKEAQLKKPAKEVSIEDVITSRAVLYTTIPVLAASEKGIKAANKELEPNRKLTPPLQNVVHIPKFEQNAGADVSLKVTPLGLFSALLDKNQVIAIGENHNEKGATDFLINNMSELKKKGVTHLFLECFDASAPSEVIMLKRYMKGEATDAELLSVIDGKPGGGGGHEFGWHSEQYLAVVRQARDNGIQVVPMDFRELPPGEIAPPKIDIPGFNSGPPGADFHFRNLHWAKTVRGNLAGTSGKGIMLGGAGHFKNSAPQVSGLMGIPYHMSFANNRLGIPSVQFYSGVSGFKGVPDIPVLKESIAGSVFSATTIKEPTKAISPGLPSVKRISADFVINCAPGVEVKKLTP